MTLDLKRAVEQGMRTLLDEFAFRPVRAAVLPFGQLVLLENSTTGIRIEFEFRDPIVFLSLYRVGADLESDRVQNTRDGPFDANDILASCSANTGLLGRIDEPFSQGAVERALGRFAEALRVHCSAVLKGDFSAFSAAAVMVESRRRGLVADDGP